MAGVLPLVDGLLDLARSVVDYMAIKEAHKYIDNVRNLQLRILEEENRAPNDIIDKRIEDLQAQLQVEVEALKAAVMAGLPQPKS